MLDVRSRDVLGCIVRTCSSGSYQVVEINDILAGVSAKYRLDGESVSQIVKHLSDVGYISVKYQDDRVFCLCPLPAGRQIVEAEEEQKKNKKKFKSMAKGAYIAVVLSALIGAFLGTLIYNLIF